MGPAPQIRMLREHLLEVRDAVRRIQLASVEGALRAMRTCPLVHVHVGDGVAGRGEEQRSAEQRGNAPEDVASAL